MKKSALFSLILLWNLTLASAASAHVTVQPPSVPADSYQVFTVRVPSEKENTATTQIKLEVPAGVEVSRFEPKPDWKYDTEKNADGKITGVVWKASGPGIGSTEFGQFNFQGKVAADATELVWKAHQTYSDGSVVDWSGAPDADKPASVTAVTAAQAGGGHDHGAAASPSTETDEHGGESGSDGITLGLAIAGLVAGIAALIVSLTRKRT